MSQFTGKSIPATFQNNAIKLKDKPYAAYKKDGKFIDISWGEMQKMVNNLSYFLLSKGIQKGDKVAIFAANRYEWHMAALAITSIGAVDVPVYATNTPEETHYVLEHSDAKLCFAGSNQQLEFSLKFRDKLPLVQEYIIFDDYSGNASGVKTLKQALSEGEAKPAADELSSRINGIRGDDLSTIIYTSGTTGNPKGVMLTHLNLYSNVAYTFEDLEKKNKEKYCLTENDIYLSFLPLSHSLERTAGFHGAIVSGAKTAFAKEISTILEDLTLVRPTIIICVPRIYEKIRAAVLGKVALAPGSKKAIFGFALRQAEKGLPKICKDLQPSGFKYKLADKLVFSKLKATLGMDRLRLAISGGAPLSVADADFFIGMGLNILEGFGLSETTPILTFNRPWDIRPGSCGQAIKETSLRIADDGELQVRGTQVMAGYYKNEDATKEAFTNDGWFRTGDVATIDNEGFLRITGRIKDIIVTAGGKNISPQNIENSVKDSRYIEQMAVIGDKRKFLSALIVPAFPELEAWAGQQGITFSNSEELLSNPQIIAFIKKEIDERTAQFARVEQIKQFTLIKAEWTQETGELTPTQKVKRKVITEKYASQIEAMYKGESGD